MPVLPAIIAIFLLVLAYPGSAWAYIGPGAGFAAAGSGLVLLTSLGMLAATIIFGPSIWLFRWAKSLKARKKARAKRVIIMGLDGLDPGLVDRYMSEGLLPNLSALKKDGDYRRLETTLPAISPVAWSSFQTGVNPGAHNIYDFITRDKRTCLPQLSSTKTESIARRALFGIFKRGDKSMIKLLRGGQPFWKILGRNGIFSNIIRVPVSYPPEPFFGTILSGMCTPDLRGSQGTFTFYTTGSASAASFAEGTGGVFQRLSLSQGAYEGAIEGPEKSSVPFSLTSEQGEVMTLRVAGESIALKKDELSRWIKLTFKVGGANVSGIVRFCLRAGAPDVALYVSPVNVDPNEPVLPISSPGVFAKWLSKRQGLFGTLGLMEDTWGRNEHALNDELFLKQSYDTHAEREEMFFSVLERTRKGLCVCVFDASDRIQHMFWRYLEDSHPAPRENEKFKDTIKEMYIKMDKLVGKARAKLDADDWLIVMSDHGFSSFRRGINLNSWLLENGYLSLKKDADPHADYLQSIDWSKTRAYAIGLAGIFINKSGRERNGVVADADFPALKAEISGKLREIIDPASGSRAIREVYDSEKSYSGMYRSEAPDLIIGCERGYRVSWDSVTGKLEKEIFTDNTKAWSGDHHVDPALVPGILFSNRLFKAEAPSILDIAPTVLNIFGIPAPKYMEGAVIQ